MNIFENLYLGNYKVRSCGDLWGRDYCTKFHKNTATFSRVIMGATRTQDMIVLYTTVGCEVQARLIILRNLVFSELWKLRLGFCGMWRKKLLDDLKDRRGYSHLKEEALDRTIWRHRFGGGFGPVVRQNTEWMMNEYIERCPLCRSHSEFTFS